MRKIFPLLFVFLCVAQLKGIETEEEKSQSPHSFTSNVSIISDYRFRGISQTFRKPALQGGFDYAHQSGLFLGTWASNVDGTTNLYNNTSLEWDIYGGIKGKVFPKRLLDLNFALGAFYYYYPGGKVNLPERVYYNTLELSVEISYKWLSVRYWQSVTNFTGYCSKNPPFNWDKMEYVKPNGSSRGTRYVEGNLNIPLPVCFVKGKKTFLFLHIGRLDIRHYPQVSYTDWRVTLTQEFAWFNLFVTYVGTNARHSFYDVPDHGFHPHRYALGAQGFVGGITRTF